jgi:uncharacterized protein (TIGR02246 family)
MKSRSFISVLATLGLVLSGCLADVTPLSDEDITMLESMTQAYRDAVLAGDADAVAAMFAADATEMPANYPVRQGREAIRAVYQQAGMAQEFQITIVHTDGVGGLAYQRGTFTGTFVVEGMEEPLVDDGKYLQVARKQDDGSWLWETVIWNSNLPLPGQQ